MNEQVKAVAVNVRVELGEESGYNRTNVLPAKGAMMSMTEAFPEGYVKEVSMEAFETAITQLKTHEDAAVRALGSAADACFLLLQLAGEESGLATQTISEYLPGLLDVIHRGKGEK